MEKKPTTVMDLLEGPIIAINVGLNTFAESLKQQNVEVVQVEWTPPAGGNKAMIELLEKLL